MLKSHRMFIWAVVIYAVVSVSGVKVRAQSPMMSPTMSPTTGGGDCMDKVYNMTDCLTYVEKDSTVKSPDKACCPELAGMLDSNPVCLCQLLGKSKDLGIELDVGRAMKLPSVCGLQTPPLSLCSVVGVPIGAPTSSAGPSSSVSGTPTAAPTTSGPSSSGGMSPEAAEPSAGKNGASNAHFSILYLVAALTIVLTSSTL